MNYRPKNWREIVVEVTSSSEPIPIGDLDSECGSMFEAGADALLSELIKNSCKLEKQNGWWVFIPDEEK